MVKKAGIGERKSGTSTAQLKAAPDTESFMGKRRGGKEKGILQAESTGLFCLGSIFNSETTKNLINMTSNADSVESSQFRRSLKGGNEVIISGTYKIHKKNNLKNKQS